MSHEHHFFLHIDFNIQVLGIWAIETAEFWWAWLKITFIGMNSQRGQFHYFATHCIFNLIVLIL